MMINFKALRRYLMPVLILSIVFMAGCRGCRDGNDSFPQAGDVPTAPSVTATYPEGGDIAIPINNKISATFNMPMVEADLGTTTFNITPAGGAAINGTVTLVGLIALFEPTVFLAPNTSYTATVNAGIRSVAGSTLAENFTWTFTTGATADIIAPSVVSTNPISDAIGVPVNTIIAVPFSEFMDPLTINSTTFFLTEAPAASIRAQNASVLLSVPGGLVTGTVSYLGKTAYFKPSSPLKLGTTYTAVITTGAKDVSGNALAENYVWSFTGVVADTAAPTVASTDPSANKTGVAINTKIAVTFSEMMSIDTITNSTFKVEGVSGTVTYDPLTKIATFKPTANLVADKVYSATITTAAQDLAGNAVTANYVWNFTTGATADTTAPTVLATVPLAAATNVSASQQITSTFSEGMESATINGTTITVKGPGGAAVAGTVTYAGTTATFIPTGGLANSTKYDATVSTGVKDLAGNAMLAAKTWSFTTGAAAPTVTSTDPLNGAINVATNKSISATFSGAMKLATINETTFTLQRPDGVAIAGAVTYTGTTATFKPSAVLANSTIYTARITTGAQDLSGTALAVAKTWSFTTGAAPDIIAPTVTSTNPADGSINVAINNSVTAVFSESMDAGTITNTTFTLTGPSGTPVVGIVSYTGTTASFKPSAVLGNSKTYTARITTGAKDLAGNAIAAVKSWSFTTGALEDKIAPTVTSVDPVDAATVVAINKTITANFSESMETSTINNTTFTVKTNSGATVDGAVSYAGTTATFNPTEDLAHSTTYVANISVGVKDQAGNAMLAAKTWSFVTGAAPDTVAPTVDSTDPVDAAVGVATNKSITAVFKENMKSSTINDVSFTVGKLGGALIDGLVTYDSTNKAATFKPTSPLANSTTYVATITTAVEDLAGNKMVAAKSWRFTTIAPADTGAPQVTVVYPAHLAKDIGCKEAITATFDEDMDPATILQKLPKVTFTVTRPDLTQVAGVVTYANKVARFVPDNDLPDSMTFTATIATQAKDLAGNELANPKVWTFTTGQSEPVLGRASSFALMATTSITGDTGSKITGDVGVSPSGRPSITLATNEITGNIYSGTDQAVVDAIADLKVAYDTAKLKATNVVTVAKKDLGGETFYPGLYKTGDTFDITAGDLTLDAQGNANAVFIFQMPETLTVAVGRHIILSGNAQASNIFWQVGSSATLNTTTIFKGNIMANVSITVNSGSDIEGRLLAGAGTAGSGAVIFDASTITIPAP